MIKILIYESFNYYLHTQAESQKLVNFNLIYESFNYYLHTQAESQKLVNFTD